MSSVVLRVHPKYESRLRGEKNGNMRALKERFGLDALTIERDTNLEEDALEVL